MSEYVQMRYIDTADRNRDMDTTEGMVTFLLDVLVPLCFVGGLLFGLVTLGGVPAIGLSIGLLTMGTLGLVYRVRLVRSR